MHVTMATGSIIQYIDVRDMQCMCSVVGVCMYVCMYGVEQKIY